MRATLIVAAAIAPLVSLALLPAGWFAAIAPLFVSHMLLLYPTLVANCQWWGPVFTRFHPDGRQVWITIDDGPSPAHTLQILDVLDRYNARATFFVIGRNAEKHPHLITEILARGHSLANHTHTHPVRTFWCATGGTIAREIDACAATLRSTPERPAVFFRAPAGLKNLFVHPVLRRRGMALIGWTVRGLDTVKRDPVAIAKRIERNTVSGAIILLHEGHRAAKHPEFEPRCMELTLERLSARGFAFVIPTPEQLRA